MYSIVLCTICGDVGVLHSLVYNMWCMGVRSLRERGSRNFIQGDLTSHKIMDSMSGGGGGGCCPPSADSTSRGGGGVLSVKTGDLI